MCVRSSYGRGHGDRDERRQGHLDQVEGNEDQDALYQDHAEWQLRHHGKPAGPEGVDHGEARASPEEAGGDRPSPGGAGHRGGRNFKGRQGETSGDDKREGAMDKAKGRLKEATGALSGDSVKKSEGRSDQRRGTLKEKKGHLKDLFK